MTYTLDGESLGNINNEVVRKLASLTAMPIPTEDSDTTQVFDYSGASREITIEGRYVDTSLANIFTNFVDVFNTILSGNQNGTSSYINYVSDLHGTIKVKLDEFIVENDTEATGPLSVAYTMRLIETEDI